MTFGRCRIWLFLVQTLFLRRGQVKSTCLVQGMPNAAWYVDASVTIVNSMGTRRYVSTKLLSNDARIEVAERLVPPVIYGAGL